MTVEQTTSAESLDAITVITQELGGRLLRLIPNSTHPEAADASPEDT